MIICCAHLFGKEEDENTVVKFLHKNDLPSVVLEAVVFFSALETTGRFVSWS